MPDALTAVTLPIYTGLGQAHEYDGLHTPWLGSYPRVRHYQLLSNGG